MADEFYLTHGALHGGTSAMDELLERYQAELQDGFVLLVEMSTVKSGAWPNISKLAELPQFKLIHSGHGSGYYTRKFGKELHVTRRDLGLDQIIEVRRDDVIAPGRGEIIAQLQTKEPEPDEAERQETDSDARLEEIRELLWESRQIGEQNREGIDSLKERSPIVK